MLRVEVNFRRNLKREPKQETTPVQQSGKEFEPDDRRSYLLLLNQGEIKMEVKTEIVDYEVKEDNDLMSIRRGHKNGNKF